MKRANRQPDSWKICKCGYPFSAHSKDSECPGSWGQKTKLFSAATRKEIKSWETAQAITPVPAHTRVMAAGKHRTARSRAVIQ